MITFNIRSLVDQKFHNISKFSEAMGITYPAAHKLYYGDISRINLETLDKLCVVLDCTPDTIFGLDTEARNNRRNLHHALFLKRLSNEIKSINETNDSLLDEINDYIQILEKR